uniref:Mucin-5AC n=1 Tax=Caenorhabditis tropicalis TaxID=1561998 RepID=A0A1I7TKK7_9PELO
MNGGRKRRFPVIVAVCSILVLVISVVTAQQGFDGNRQLAFVRRQPQFQQPNQVGFQPNRNFVLPSASPLRHRNLFTRQISHRLRPRQRSSSLKSRTNTTHQPAHLTTRRLIPTLSHKRTRSRIVVSSSSSFPSRTKQNVTRVNANQRTTKVKSNISRRQPQQFHQRQQPFMIQQRQQQFRFQQTSQPFQRVQRLQQFQRTPVQNQRLFMRQGSTRAPLSIRAPLSPMPFGSVQRTPSSSLRRPSNRSSLRPSTPQTPLTTTTQLPITSPSIPTTTTQPVSLSSTTHIATIHSVGGSLRRPIRVQQLQLNLRRKPQMTRGQFRRPQSNSKFPLTRHQPTHRVTKPDRITRPISSTTTTESTIKTSTESTSLTVSGTTPEGIQREPNDLNKVDDIEAAVLQALLESSSPEPPPSTTHRQRIHRIRPGHRHRPAASPRVDAIEEAVLRAVLEANPSVPEETTTSTSIEETTTQLTTTEDPITTTTQKSESTSLFPAFANRRHGHRRPFSPSTINPTEIITSSIPTTSENPTTESTTTESEEPTTVVSEETTTTESVTGITIALPEDSFEDINSKAETENHQIHQIEENVISALSTPTSTISPSSPIPPSPLPSPSPSPSPSPPSPPAPPPREFNNQIGPPGSMPPSDDIVDELNESSDFLQVAQRLHLLRRLLQ